MSFVIDGRKIGHNEPPYIIAELSANHNGNLERALETIDAAQRCGAHAIKLQTYSADTMTIDCDRPEFMIKGGLWDGYKLHDLYKWAQTPFEWHPVIFEHARKRGITIFSTPFDESAVDLLESLNAPAYKIASFEVTDLPLIRYVAATGKPIIMSTGMANEREIEEAVEAARSAGARDLVLLHCISSYPAPMNQANLRQMAELERRFETIPGLSDHTMGTTASVAAVALGACLIEKHFTLSRADKGPDSEFSLEPEELKRLCSDAYDAWSALGKTGYQRQQAEEGNKIFRRSVYFVNDVAAGAPVSASDIRRIRPGLGLAPKYFDDIVGKKLKVAVSRGTPTSWDLFDE
ncbi:MULTISPECIES: pseudaminic acid synthase [unclassified Pseudomonas]|jgi:N-acetylneuraminate synthase|uniref:pseudaminic acid synthase n=1 Tax=unclassified Pseudomonas TaxID=196821 RepID=UPI0008ED5A69|nr:MULTISPECIES: pseudaminic acid synthase [unclassified Pseudomonas]MXR32812.1 pseudaminic acid synthase [Pseudomonas sp. PICF6]SFH03038.1 N-acetylneuraminate synthase [Pseudomonas sp. NFACC45]SIR49276.1 N-acetylneuraminate synthase [Pseudomonas sp. A214]